MTYELPSDIVFHSHPIVTIALCNMVDRSISDDPILYATVYIVGCGYDRR